MAVEYFHHLGEVRQRPREAVDLVDYDHLDQLLANLLERAVDGLPRSARPSRVRETPDVSAG
jgi:hypothetical protein